MLRKERKWNHVKCSVKIINGWKRMEEKNRNKWQEQQIETMIKMVVVNPSCEVAQSCPTLCDPMDCSPPAPPSMEFSRQEYWSGLPFPSPGDLPNPGIEAGSPALQAVALPSEPPGNPTKAIIPLNISGHSKSDLGEQMTLLSVSGCHPVHWVLNWTKQWRRGGFTLSAWAETPVFSHPWTLLLVLGLKD